jgi:hypothetical protein
MSVRKGGLGCILHIAFLAIFITSIPVSATQFCGGKGLTIVQFPSLIPPGALNIKVHARAYTKGVSDYTLNTGTAAISFNFGFSKHMELGATQILYQNLNGDVIGIDKLDQVPDDTYLRFKLGNFPFTLGNAYFKFGLLNQLRYRTGLVDNIYLEPYVGYGIDWEIDLLLSYYTNPLYEDNAPAFHANLGYLNHNDAGLGQSPLKAAQEIVYGLAYVYPTRHFDFYLENSGAFFTRYPAETIYSRENAIWLTPGVKYKLFMGFSLTMAMDVLLYEEDDSTLPGLGDEWPNYPDWRFNGTISYNPATAFYHLPPFSQVDDPRTTRQLLRDRKSLFEWVVDEQDGLEYIDLELEKIKAERQKAEEELEELKEELNQP